MKVCTAHCQAPNMSLKLLISRSTFRRAGRRRVWTNHTRSTAGGVCKYCPESREHMWPWNWLGMESGPKYPALQLLQLYNLTLSGGTEFACPGYKAKRICVLMWPNFTLFCPLCHSFSIIRSVICDELFMVLPRLLLWSVCDWGKIHSTDQSNFSVAKMNLM